MTGQGTPPEDPIIAECLGFYRRARDGVRGSRSTSSMPDAREPPPAFRAELERYKATLGKLQKAMIRQLNDRLRTTGQGGRLLVTRGVMERGEAFVAKATRPYGRLLPSRPRTTPMRSTTSARLRSRTCACSSRSTATTRTSAMARPIRPTRISPRASSPSSFPRSGRRAAPPNPTGGAFAFTTWITMSWQRAAQWGDPMLKVVIRQRS